MEDIKLYDYLLKLNTFLQRQNNLASRMLEQEQKFLEKFMEARAALPPPIFHVIFDPIMEIVNKRIGIMEEMRESSQELIMHSQEFYDQYKGIVQ